MTVIKSKDVSLDSMKCVAEAEAYLNAFLTSALDGSQWLTSQSGYFTFRERALRCPLHVSEKQDISSPYRKSNHDSSIA